MRNHHDHLLDQELLLALDHELSSRSRELALEHVRECQTCRARLERVRETSAAVASAYVNRHGDQSLEDAARARERLSLKLKEMAGRWNQSWSTRLLLNIEGTPRWVSAAGAVAALVLVFRLVMSPAFKQGPEHGSLPIASITPGATWDIGVQELCAHGRREYRQIPEAVQQDVVRRYGMEGVSPSEYELDYLITPELGGAPDARNLWPQRYGSRVWNAYVKDELERLLPRMVCEGQIDLATAQSDIAKDWVGAYKKYFNTPVPLGARAGAFSGDATLSGQDDLTYPVWRTVSAPVIQVVSFKPAY